MVATPITLRFDGRSMADRLFIKGN